MLEQNLGEGVAAGVPKKARKTIKLRTLGRQRLRLLVVDHLQPVLDRAQETVCGFHVVARGRVDPAVVAELIEGGEGVAVAQRRITAARDQLLGLREKLDLANAATAELDVVALDRDLSMPAIGVDLPLHGVYVGDGGEIEIFAPHEGRQFVEDSLTPVSY